MVGGAPVEAPAKEMTAVAAEEGAGAEAGVAIGVPNVTLPVEGGAEAGSAEAGALNPNVPSGTGAAAVAPADGVPKEKRVGSAVVEEDAA